jgi:serine/threonine protein kinase
VACLNENEALAFIRGETRAEGASQVEDHVAGCPECQALLSLMVQHSLLDTSSDGEGDDRSLIGRRVGNFVITGLLGRGGMGEVYLATHPEIGRQVAIKVLAVPVPEHAQRFLNEARVMAALRHPNVVEVHDFGELEHSGQPYYVMELLRGPSLADVIRERSPMSLPEVLRYLEPICAGLQAAHDAGVVHRDLKPANIIVLEGDQLRVKLVDFGLAKLTRTTEPPSDIGTTTPGMVMGTPQFLAPEQAKGEQERIGPATDIYALGVTLYWMLAGKAPFVARTPSSVIAQHLGEPPPPLAGLSPGVARVVERCLAKDPADRPSRAREVADAFRASIGAGGRRSVAWRWLLAAAGAAAVAAVALVWGTSRRPEPRPPSQTESDPIVAREAASAEENERPDSSVPRLAPPTSTGKPRTQEPGTPPPRRSRARRRGAGPRQARGHEAPTTRPARVGEGTLPFQ